jgi:hypothetical protein
LRIFVVGTFTRSVSEPPFEYEYEYEYEYEHEHEHEHDICDWMPEQSD